MGELVQLYTMMRRIRCVEEVLAELYFDQEMRCPVHLCIGHEAVAVGVCDALRTDDIVYSNHRAHGHYLAKGGNIRALVAEFYGRKSGCCGGRGGSMHLIDRSVGFMGATPIVGGSIPLAVGTSWAAKLRGETTVAVVFFGDGCFEEGVMHESLNFAALHALPVLFVCENNRLAVYTSLRERQPGRPIYEVARAHGWRVFHGDGSDVNWVSQAADTAVAHARSGSGPCFLEVDVYRWREHCGPNFDDELCYRSEEEIRLGLDRDPLERCRALLDRATGDLDALDAEIMNEVRTVFAWARAQPEAVDGLAETSYV